MNIDYIETIIVSLGLNKGFKNMQEHPKPAAKGDEEV